jgi:AraC-like DNA-binding protein
MAGPVAIPRDAPAQAEPAEQLYLKALALMDAQIDRVDADGVASQLGVSRRYLDKLFSRSGRSFARHLWDRRLALAAQWLQRPGPVSVTEVAHGVGFKDSSHFTRLFRARYGQSPRSWTRGISVADRPADQLALAGQKQAG